MNNRRISLARGSLTATCVLALVFSSVACDRKGEEEQPPAGGTQTTIRRPAPGGIVFHATRDSRYTVSENHRTGEYRIIGAPLEEQIGFAYGVDPRDVLIDYDHNEKLRFHAIVRPRDKSIESARSMLAERISEERGVVIEERELPLHPVFVLRRAKATLVLPASTAEKSDIAMKPGEIRMLGQPISKLVSILRDATKRPVVDETELDEEYDFLLQWDPAAGSYAAIQALRDVGLEMESAQQDYTQIVVKRPQDAAPRRPQAQGRP